MCIGGNDRWRAVRVPSRRGPEFAPPDSVFYSAALATISPIPRWYSTRKHAAGCNLDEVGHGHGLRSRSVGHGLTSLLWKHELEAKYGVHEYILVLWKPFVYVLIQ